MSQVKEKIEQYLSPLIEEQDLFLVETKVSPGNKIIVYLDGMQGVSIDQCKSISRTLLNEAALEDTFTKHALEVSSPGLNNPLIHMKQYEKNIGRQLNITLNDGSTQKGKLTNVNTNEIVLERSKKNKKTKKEEISKLNIIIDNIKKAKVQVSFK